MKSIPSLMVVVALSFPLCFCAVVPRRDTRFYAKRVSVKHETLPYMEHEYLENSPQWKHETFSIRQGSPSPPPTPPLTDEEVGEKYEEYDYDPNGEGENLYALKNLDEILEVSETKDEAVDRENKEYPGPGEGHNDEADAFRHAYFNAKLASEIGAENAKGWADAHEVSGENPVGETLMDLHNNKVGREIGKRLDNPTDDEIADAVKEAIRNGDLLTEPVAVGNPRGGNENNQYNSDYSD